MKITAKLLKKRKACQPAIDEFIELGLEGIDVYDLIKMLEKRKDSNDYSLWLFGKFKLTGRCRGWYENKQRRYNHNYERGESHWRCRGWYLNGKTSSDFNYEHGNMHGRCRSWYPNGEPCYDENYKHGWKVIK